MIDVGLLSSMAVIVAIVFVVKRWVPPLTLGTDTLGGVVANPVFAGVLVARLVAVALDDPSTLGRPRDLLLIRGGMEFWAGALAAVVVAGIGAHRAKVPVLARLGDLAVYALVAYAAFEATCVLRDGCFGPISPIGIRPRGLGAPEFPTGLFVGLAALGLAVVVRRCARRSGGMAVWFTAGGLASVRFAAAFALPHIGTGPSRPQFEAGAVIVGTAVVGGVAWLWAQRADIASESETTAAEESCEAGGTGLSTSAVKPTKGVVG